MDEEPPWLCTTATPVSSAAPADDEAAAAVECAALRILRYSSCSSTLMTMSVCLRSIVLGCASSAVTAGRYGSTMAVNTRHRSHSTSNTLLATSAEPLE